MWDIVDELKSSPKSHIAVLKMVAAFRKWLSNWFAFCQFSFDRKISRIQCTKVWKKKLNDVNGFFVPLNMAISTNLASYKNKYQNRQRKESRKDAYRACALTKLQLHTIFIYLFFAVANPIFLGCQSDCQLYGENAQKEMSRISKTTINPSITVARMSPIDWLCEAHIVWAHSEEDRERERKRAEEIARQRGQNFL